jgi:hypothetical protein
MHYKNTKIHLAKNNIHQNMQGKMHFTFNIKNVSYFISISFLLVVIFEFNIFLIIL